MNLLTSFTQSSSPSTGESDRFTPEERAQLLANSAYIRGRVEALPEDIATETSLQQVKEVGLAAKASADSVEAYFSVVPPGTPAIVLPSPTIPRQHLVPVLFHSGQFGVTDPKAQVQFALVDETPILIEGINEVPAPISPTKDMTNFTVYPGCFLWTSDYLESQGASGIYYANSSTCKLTKLNAQFRVPPLPVGKTAWFLAELLRLNRP